MSEEEVFRLLGFTTSTLIDSVPLRVEMDNETLLTSLAVRLRTKINKDYGKKSAATQLHDIPILYMCTRPQKSYRKNQAEKPTKRHLQIT